MWLGAASKPNRRSTAGSVRFRAVVIVKNNRNRPEPDGTAGQPAVGFWSRPLPIAHHISLIDFQLFAVSSFQFCGVFYT